MPWVIPVAMAVAGTIKGIQAQNSASNQRSAQAEVTRYSPWTGMHGQSVADPEGGVLGSTIQGGAAGIGLGQNISKFNAEQDALKAQIPSGQEYTSSTGSIQGAPSMPASPPASGMSMGLSNASQSPYSFNGLQGSAGALQGAGMGVQQNPYAAKSPWSLLPRS